MNAGSVPPPWQALALLGVSAEATLDQLHRAWRSLARTLHPDVGGDEASMRALNAAYEVCCRFVDRRDGPHLAEVPADVEPISRDVPSFVIEALPVVAFEALLVAASWIGEVLVDEPPYLLEVHLHEPVSCWCRLELVPDAGATTVSLTVAAVEGAAAPSTVLVRDQWIGTLNELPLPD